MQKTAIVPVIQRTVAADYHWPRLVTLAWLTLNLADSLLTRYILQNGGAEVGLSYQIGYTMAGVVTVKWVAVLLIPFILYECGVIRWLKWFLPVVIIPVLWNVVQVLMYA